MPLFFRFTILHSHGNAVDLGQMSSFYLSLGTKINCNIFSYDYSGYGVSTGMFCPYQTDWIIYFVFITKLGFLQILYIFPLFNKIYLLFLLRVLNPHQSLILKINWKYSFVVYTCGSLTLRGYTAPHITTLN